MTAFQVAVTIAYFGMFFLLLALVTLVAVHMIFLRRTQNEELHLIRRQSEAITWLTDYAKRDLEAQATQTRQAITDVVREQVGEVKQKLDESSLKDGGTGS